MAVKKSGKRDSPGVGLSNKLATPSPATPPPSLHPTPPSTANKAPRSSLLRTAKGKRPYRKRPLEPEEEEPKAILDRIFARYAKSVNGLQLDPLPGQPFSPPIHHFDDATSPDAPPLPPDLLINLVKFYFENARPRSSASNRISAHAVGRFANSVKKFYHHNKGERLPSDHLKSLNNAVHKLEKKCSPGRVRELLTTETLDVLVAKIWDSEYKAQFRQRFDLTLYTALTISTGQPSKLFLGQGGHSHDITHHTAACKKEGVCWRDFRIFMSSSGPFGYFDSPTEPGRSYPLLNGSSIGLSTALLVIVGMSLDGVVGVPLDYLMSEDFLRGRAFHQVELDVRRYAYLRVTDLCACNPVFRIGRTDNVQRRTGINAELRRVSRIAQFENSVTTGSLRALVARKVYEHHNLEYANVVLGHSTLLQTHRYLKNKTTTAIGTEELELGESLPAHERAEWKACPKDMRNYAIQQVPNLIAPYEWARDPVQSRPSPIPPTPSPPSREWKDPTLSRLAAWMTGPPDQYLSAVDLVPDLDSVQYYYRKPLPGELEPIPALALADDVEYDEESCDSDDSD